MLITEYIATGWKYFYLVLYDILKMITNIVPYFTVTILHNKLQYFISKFYNGL